jgi:hypothetical protein
MYPRSNDEAILQNIERELPPGVARSRLAGSITWTRACPRNKRDYRHLARAIFMWRISGLQELKHGRIIYFTSSRKNDTRLLSPFVRFCCFYPFFKRKSSMPSAVLETYLPPTSRNSISTFLNSGLYIRSSNCVKFVIISRCLFLVGCNFLL